MVVVYPRTCQSVVALWLVLPWNGDTRADSRSLAVTGRQAATAAPTSAPQPTTGADLSIKTSAVPSSLRSGDMASYTIIVTNAGPEAATGVVVTDKLPGQFNSVLCSATDGGVCSTVAGVWSATFDRIPVKGSVTVTLMGRLNATAGPLTTVANTAAVSATTPDPAPANNTSEAKLTVEPDLRFGILAQPQADWTEDTTTDDYAQNLFLRRLRILFCGQITRAWGFFVETDSPNLGKITGTTKTISSGLILQDAYIDYTPTVNFSVQAGLLLVPFCRNCNQSAAMLYSMDYGAFSFLSSAPSQAVAGRDTGVQLKGYFLTQHLRYRLAAVQGFRDTGSTNAFRYAGRAQYSFFDPDVVPYFYAGTMFGAKKLLTVGAAFDTQQSYHGYAGDVFLDLPVGKAGVFTLQGDLYSYNGSQRLPTLKEQTDYMFETGYLFKSFMIAPYIKLEGQRFADDLLKKNDLDRMQLGGAWFFKNHNANLKLAYTHIDPDTGNSSNGVTAQLQIYYY